MKISGGYALGYAIAAVIAALFLWMVNIIFFSHRKITDEQISKYMTDTVNIKTYIARIPILEILDDKTEALGTRGKSIITFINRNGNGYLDYKVYVFYEKEYKKYFSLMSFETGIFMNGLGSQNMIVEMTVNKQELNDPALGIKTNPIPVLKFIGVDKSLRPDNQDYDKAYMDSSYRINVKLYLEYLMPKKEFKARFGK